MSSSSRLPPLDAILNTMNTLEKTSKEQPKMWNPMMQTQIMSQGIGQPLTPGSENIGKTLMAATPPAGHQDLFMQNYINKQDGQRDLAKTMQTAASVHKQATIITGSTPREHQCRVFPPLLVRYDDPKTHQDAFIPVELYAGGEIHYARGFPDMILNFHADTHAITLTTCKIDPQKMREYEIAMQVLYSLVTVEPDKMLTVAEFTMMYDAKRYALLRSLAMRGSMPK